MKKILSILFVLLTVIILSSCSKKDNGGDVEDTSYLVSTTWSGVNDNVKVSLFFTKYNGASLQFGHLTPSWYDYYEKSGIIYLKPQKEGYNDFECTISGENMEVKNAKAKVFLFLQKE